MNAQAKIHNILLVGVGGQGILLAGKVISEAALLAGYDVKKSEIHGMSQRGGAVNTHVRFGDKVYSPIIPRGQADLLVALEQLEALRWEYYLKPGGIVVVNDFRIKPALASTGKVAYAEDAIGQLKQRASGEVIVVDGPGLAREAGDLRTMNVVLLGVLSTRLDLPQECWQAGLSGQVKNRFLEVNSRAFDLGRKLGENGRPGA